jgi:hypothetical protein
LLLCYGQYGNSRVGNPYEYEQVIFNMSSKSNLCSLVSALLKFRTASRNFWSTVAAIKLIKPPFHKPTIPSSFHILKKVFSADVPASGVPSCRVVDTTTFVMEACQCEGKQHMSRQCASWYNGMGCMVEEQGEQAQRTKWSLNCSGQQCTRREGSIY